CETGGGGAIALAPRMNHARNQSQQSDGRQDEQPAALAGNEANERLDAREPDTQQAARMPSVELGARGEGQARSPRCAKADGMVGGHDGDGHGRAHDEVAEHAQALPSRNASQQKRSEQGGWPGGYVFATDREREASTGDAQAARGRFAIA